MSRFRALGAAWQAAQSPIFLCSPVRGKPVCAMGEFSDVPFDQAEILAVMLGVAGEAGLALVPVVAAAGLDAGGQVLVAGQAFAGIDLFLFRVAEGAILDPGQPGVDPAQLAGGDQQLRIARRERAGAQQKAESGRQKDGEDVVPGLPFPALRA